MTLLGRWGVPPGCTHRAVGGVTRGSRAARRGRGRGAQRVVELGGVDRCVVTNKNKRVGNIFTRERRGSCVIGLPFGRSWFSALRAPFKARPAPTISYNNKEIDQRVAGRRRALSESESETRSRSLQGSQSEVLLTR